MRSILKTCLFMACSLMDTSEATIKEGNRHHAVISYEPPVKESKYIRLS